MENLPIDIHSNKLLDWLISRRHCPKNWQDAVDVIRPKIRHAMQDMPECERIVEILRGGQYINYFHCKQILEILHDTERDTKNIFGFYSSQRIKDWKEIIGLYEKDGVYLAEAANFLQRFVQYEVPALRKQITKAENGARESERKQLDYVRQAADSRRTFERQLAKWGLPVDGKSQSDLRGALLAAADGQPAVQLGLEGRRAVGKAIHYFRHFARFVGQPESADTLFPLLTLLSVEPDRPVSEISVFEWRYGKKPDVLIPAAKLAKPADLMEKQEERDDEIDFGDDDAEADIDFCTNGNDNGDSLEIEGIQLVDPEQAVGIGDPFPANGAGIARGDDALPLLEHPPTVGTLLDQLDQLRAFLHFRLEEELAEDTTGLFHLAAMAANERPKEIAAVQPEQLRSWLTQVDAITAQLGDPQRLQMLRIRTSESFLQEIVSGLEQKRRLEFKYQQLERQAAQRQSQCAEEAQKAQQQLELIIEAAKGLQENLEADISKRYNGREVYIMGEINAVLYGS